MTYFVWNSDLENLSLIFRFRMRPEIKWFQDRRNLILFVQVKNAGDPLDVNLSEDTVGLR